MLTFRTAKEAAEHCKPQLKEYLISRGIKINSDKTFRCINPNHEDKHPSMSITPGNQCKCYSCDALYDIFDAAEILENCDKPTAFKRILDFCNCRIENPTGDKNAEIHAKNAEKPATQEEPKREQPAETYKHKDYSNYIKLCKTVLYQPAGQPGLDYLKGRGLSEFTLKQYNIGYDPQLYFFDGKYPAVIFGQSGGGYNARNIAPNIDKKQRFKKGANQQDSLFGTVEELSKTDGDKYPVIITEGELDALSLLEAGAPAAVAVGGAQNQKELIELAESGNIKRPLIIAMDNDDPGKKAAATLIQKLSETANPPQCFKINLYGTFKDANEILVAEPETLTQRIYNAMQDPDAAQAETLRAEYIAENNTAAKLPEFWERLKDKANAKVYPTRSKALNRLLDGGFQTGLYFIGAISSAGKTSLALQWADEFAADGNDVLIISLEMAQAELIAKSISRLSFQYAKENAPDLVNYARTTRGVLLSGTQEQPDAARELLTAAGIEYAKIAEHIFIYDGVGDISIKDIARTLEAHTTATGRAPILIIDYVQILQPLDPHDTDKRNTDRNATALKRLSKQYNIPIIGISSFNRENYTQPVNLASFKESGAIEYSSDTLLALQYYGMDYRDGEKDGARQSRIRALIKEQDAAGSADNPRKMQLKVLKNRNGLKGETYYSFYSSFNTLEEATPEDWTQELKDSLPFDDNGFKDIPRQNKTKRRTKEEPAAGEPYTAEITEIDNEELTIPFD